MICQQIKRNQYRQRQNKQNLLKKYIGIKFIEKIFKYSKDNKSLNNLDNNNTNKPCWNMKQVYLEVYCNNDKTNNSCRRKVRLEILLTFCSTTNICSLNNTVKFKFLVQYLTKQIRKQQIYNLILNHMQHIGVILT